MKKAKCNSAGDIAWLAMSATGLHLARRLQQGLGRGRVHGLGTRAQGADVLFDDARAHIATLFGGGHTVVGICAAGILIRSVASQLADKHREPPLLALSEDGASVVPLLGGHHGGNELARDIAAVTGGVAVITTRSDARYGLALDAPPPGWRLANPQHHKTFVAGLADGQGLQLVDQRAHGSGGEGVVTVGDSDGQRPAGSYRADKRLVTSGDGAGDSTGDNNVRGDADIAWLVQSRLPFRHHAPRAILLAPPRTALLHADAHQGDEQCLVYHAARIAIGVGCERDTSPQELLSLVQGTMQGHGISPLAVALVASIDLKRDEAAVNYVATALGVPVHFYDAATLHAERARLASPSATVFAETGCYGVAEGAALAAMGADGALIVPKQKSTRATCALALAPCILHADKVAGSEVQNEVRRAAEISPAAGSSSPGLLSLVGIGPGDEKWRSAEAVAVLHSADEVVGYALYLQLAGFAVGDGDGESAYRPADARYAAGDDSACALRDEIDADDNAGRGKAGNADDNNAGRPRVHAFAIGEERARVDKSIALAQQGRRVALVCSGDPGIYALASLVYEVLHQRDIAITVRVVPGISALQAAAARAGAPLGHDFCALSLSDLLTPWCVIEKRITAAAAGDFVIAFYNPASQRRTEQLPRACNILLQHRAPQTPVVIARNLGRSNEHVHHTTLGALASEAVDMLSIVLVGASQSCTMQTVDGIRMYTPRGYVLDDGDDDGHSHSEEGGHITAHGLPGTRGEVQNHNLAPAMVHFIGAGPGAADLITVRGRELIRQCPVILYAGSLVPRELLREAAADARVVDTAPMTLEQIMREMEKAHSRGFHIARVHSGDPSLYGAIAEQIRRLDALHIPWDITPGVPAFAAAAAVLGRALTLPEISQTVILTRTTMKASPMPASQELARLGAAQATLVIHLSVRNLRRVQEELIPHYGEDCPAAVVYRATWPEQHIIRASLGELRAKVRAAKITRTALIVVGRVLAETAFEESRLYSAEHRHLLRPQKAAGP